MAAGSLLSQILQNWCGLAQLIIWDEAPMMNKHIHEAMDRTFRDLVGMDVPFGGKVVVFGEGTAVVEGVLGAYWRWHGTHSLGGWSGVREVAPQLCLPEDKRNLQGLVDSIFGDARWSDKDVLAHGAHHSCQPE
jgi:hypothetical protein